MCCTRSSTEYGAMLQELREPNMVKGNSRILRIPPIRSLGWIRQGKESWIRKVGVVSEQGQGSRRREGLLVLVWLQHPI